jgi:hypothetical protein
MELSYVLLAFYLGGRLRFGETLSNVHSYRDLLTGIRGFGSLFIAALSLSERLRSKSFRRSVVSSIAMCGRRIEKYSHFFSEFSFRLRTLSTIFFVSYVFVQYSFFVSEYVSIKILVGFRFRSFSCSKYTFLPIFGAYFRNVTLARSNNVFVGITGLRSARVEIFGNCDRRRRSGVSRNEVVAVDVYTGISCKVFFDGARLSIPISSLYFMRSILFLHVYVDIGNFTKRADSPYLQPLRYSLLMEHVLSW